MSELMQRHKQLLRESTLTDVIDYPAYCVESAFTAAKGEAFLDSVMNQPDVKAALDFMLELHARVESNRNSQKQVDEALFSQEYGFKVGDIVETPKGALFLSSVYLVESAGEHEYHLSGSKVKKNGQPSRIGAYIVLPSKHQ